LFQLSILSIVVTNLYYKKSLKIQKGLSESVKEQTTQWPKEKRTKGETPIHKINNVDMYAYQNVVLAYF